MVVAERTPCKGYTMGFGCVMDVNRLGWGIVRNGVRFVVFAKERHWSNGSCRVLDVKSGRCGFPEQESNFLITLRDDLIRIKKALLPRA